MWDSSDFADEQGVAAPAAPPSMMLDDSEWDDLARQLPGMQECSHASGVAQHDSSGVPAAAAVNVAASGSTVQPGAPASAALLLASHTPGVRLGAVSSVVGKT